MSADQRMKLIERAAADILAALEIPIDDKQNAGMKDTPRRFAKALLEMTGGYEQNPDDLLTVFKKDDVDELVMVNGIQYFSLCEHHCLPFSGQMVVGYIPQDGRVVGLSKIPRLVECYARRFQMQERLTHQVVDTLMKNLKPLGVAAIGRARHLCMCARGVRSSGEMVTSVMKGVFLSNPSARSEFMALANFGK